MTHAPTHHLLTLSILAAVLAFCWWAGRDIWTRGEQAIQAAQEAHQTMLNERCYVHGDYNMADAWCRYQAEGMKQ